MSKQRSKTVTISDARLPLLLEVLRVLVAPSDFRYARTTIVAAQNVRRVLRRRYRWTQGMIGLMRSGRATRLEHGRTTRLALGMLWSFTRGDGASLPPHAQFDVSTLRSFVKFECIAFETPVRRQRQLSRAIDRLFHAIASGELTEEDFREEVR